MMPAAGMIWMDAYSNNSVWEPTRAGLSSKSDFRPRPFSVTLTDFGLGLFSVKHLRRFRDVHKKIRNSHAR
jgi:hypothetical protein